MSDHIREDENLYHVFDDRTKNALFDLREIAEMLPFPDIEGKDVLDVGACDGFWATEFTRRGANKVVSIDVIKNPYFDDRIREFGDPDRTEHHILNVYDLNDEIGTFDFCYCGAVLCHLDNPFKALSNIYSVMREGGTFILSTPVISGGDMPLALLCDIGKGTYLWPNMIGGAHMLKEAGFSEVEMYGTFDMRENDSVKYNYKNGVWIARR